MLAEPTGVPWTGLDFGGRVNVKVQTLWIRALAVLCKEPALGHSLEIVLYVFVLGIESSVKSHKSPYLVQELAEVSL